MGQRNRTLGCEEGHPYAQVINSMRGAFLLISHSVSTGFHSGVRCQQSSASEPAAPASLIPADRDPWQIGVGFQYLQFNVLGQTFHDFGYQADVTRYFNNWFGVEGTAIAGFGHAAVESQH